MVLRVCDRFLKHIHAAHLGGAGWFFFFLSFSFSFWSCGALRLSFVGSAPFPLPRSYISSIHPALMAYVRTKVRVCMRYVYVHLFCSCNFVTCSVYEKRINNAQIAISESVTWNFEGGEGRNGGRRRWRADTAEWVYFCERSRLSEKITCILAMVY